MERKLPVIEILLMSYKAFDGKIQGRTSLQKRIYFIGRRLEDKGCLNFHRFNYGPHYYGPFSGAVESANRDLVNISFVREYPYVITGRRGFDYHRYDYKLTEDGEHMAGKLINSNQEVWDHIQQAAKEILSANLSTAAISVAAKSHFIVKNKDKPITTPEIKNVAGKLGWDLKEGEIDEADDFLVSFRLIKIIHQSPS